MKTISFTELKQYISETPAILVDGTDFSFPLIYDDCIELLDYVTINEVDIKTIKIIDNKILITLDNDDVYAIQLLIVKNI